MRKLTRRLSFRKVSELLDIDLDDVRALVVEERRIPAVYVRHSGYSEAYDEYQLIRVDAEGKAFDMVSGGLNSDIHSGFLRVERDVLDRFMFDNGLPSIRESSVEKSDDHCNKDTVEASAAQVISNLSDPERRLKRLRDMGGKASYHMGKWSFKGTNALAAIEASEGRPRSSQKTVKQDLEDAAEAERKAKRDGITSSPFPT